MNTIPDKFVVTQQAFEQLNALMVWCATPVPQIAFDRNLINRTADDFNERVMELWLDLFFENCSNVAKVMNNQDPPYVVSHIEVKNGVLVAIAYYSQGDMTTPHEVPIVVG